MIDYKALNTPIALTNRPNPTRYANAITTYESSLLSYSALRLSRRHPPLFLICCTSFDFSSLEPHSTRVCALDCITFEGSYYAECTRSIHPSNQTIRRERHAERATITEWEGRELNCLARTGLTAVLYNADAMCRYSSVQFSSVQHSTAHYTTQYSFRLKWGVSST